jgi:hypothetical protein
MSRLQEHTTPDLRPPQAQQPARRATRASLVAIRCIAAALVVCGASGALAGDRQVSVSEQVDVAASPTHTWDAIKDFDGWQTWHPAFARTEITQGVGNAHGTVRVLTANDGARFTEELVTYNPTSRLVRYRIIDSPAPITEYVSTLQVKPHKDGSTVVWSSRFKVNEGTTDADAKKAIAGIYRMGLDHLAVVLN